jgi:hypothetical protein
MSGGFLAGLVLTLPVWLRRGARGYWQATEAIRHIRKPRFGGP